LSFGAFRPSMWFCPVALKLYLGFGGNAMP
jgi:hypothetical protein